MRKIVTLFKITFFSLLVVGFGVTQYCWLKSIQKDKLEQCETNIVSGINNAAVAMPVNEAGYTLKENTLTALLHQSFAARNLGDIHFEYSIVKGSNRLSTKGFDQTQLNNSRDKVWYYQFQDNGISGGYSGDQLIVVIKSWEKIALKGMGWLIAASLLLTTLLLIVFCYGFLMMGRKQQLLYDNRTTIIKDMLQQLETPLSTVSVAVEALRNDGVMHDSKKINYYQQIINEENKRMNEQVNKLLRDLV
ncbi:MULTISPECIES: histidine kinase dimerization/phospho-acceptor domain-containing protein [Niastella]|uniref:histidine kinase n=1 Tax=Niastella soli TaxID=2821487 RepID=A0ABS3YYK0_9BACT|nr:histidine kinase dimerization/phospho-acceptor domain-containing protein [Niastella soli]MBO9203002.1 hypothetical protein [Niastella soli]